MIEQRRCSILPEIWHSHFIYVSPVLSTKLTKSYSEIYTFHEIENAIIPLGVFKTSKIALPLSMAFTCFMLLASAAFTISTFSTPPLPECNFRTPNLLSYHVWCLRPCVCLMVLICISVFCSGSSSCSGSCCISVSLTSVYVSVSGSGWLWLWLWLCLCACLSGLAWPGLVWPGLAWPGLAWSV